MAKVAIGLGSNLGDRTAHLQVAVHGLCALLEDVVLSRVYDTEPEMVKKQGRFLNAAMVAVTRLEPRDLLSELLNLEAQMGRRRPAARFGPRVIDLDLLLFDELVIEEPELVVPHPRLRERAFVLQPLAELAPDWTVPSAGRGRAATVRELADNVDPSGVSITDIELTR